MIRRNSLLLCLLLVAAVLALSLPAVAADARFDQLRIGPYNSPYWLLDGRPTTRSLTVTGARSLTTTLTPISTTRYPWSNTITGARAAGSDGLYVTITQNSTALTGSLIGLDVVATNGSTSGATSGWVTGAQIKGRAATSGNVGAALKGIQGVYISADVKNKAVESLRGLEVSLDGGAGGSSTTATGIVVYNNTSASQTTAYGLSFNAGAVSGHHLFDYDLQLGNGETIDNSTNGTVQIVTPALKQAYDAAAYYTATVADGGAVTFEETSDGTDGFVFKDPITFCPDGGTPVVSAGLLGGAGTATGTPQIIGAAGGKALSFYVASSSTTASHVVQGLYMNLNLGSSGASAGPSGDAIRGRTYVIGDLDNGGVMTTGGSFSVEYAANTATNVNWSAGLRGNIVLPDAVMAGGGSHFGAVNEIFLGGAATDTTAMSILAPLCLEIGGTAPTAASQVANIVAMNVVVPANMVTGDATMIVTGGAADTCDAKMKISINGTPYWVMLSVDDE